MRSTLLASLSAALLLGCGPGPGSGSGADGGTPQPLADFCSAVLDGMCAKTAECKGGAAADWCTAIDKPTACDQVTKAVAAGRTTYDASQASACLSYLHGLSCVAFASRDEADNACKHALQGKVDPGSQCYDDVECKAGSFCKKGAVSCPGVCKLYASGGASCSDASGDRCLSGYSCVGGTCTQDVGSAATCSTGANAAHCGPGLYCKYANPNDLTGTCAAQLTSGTCKNLYGDCADKYACTGWTIANKAGSCAAAKQPGDACTPGANECNLLYYCSTATSKCVIWNETGGECGLLGQKEFAPCVHSFCDANPPISWNGTCQAPLAAGASCTKDEQCGDGAACAGTPKVCVRACREP